MPGTPLFNTEIDLLGHFMACGTGTGVPAQLTSVIIIRLIYNVNVLRNYQVATRFLT